MHNERQGGKSGNLEFDVKCINISNLKLTSLKYLRGFLLSGVTIK